MGGTSTYETPSGKDAAYENFPVGSWLLAADLRPHVAVFYDFARAIDDIADNPDLTPSVKIDRLDAFGRAVTGETTTGAALVKGHRMRDSLAGTGITDRHCLDLIAAFKLDAVKTRYRSWDDLMDYCVLSAAPVGRYLLDLHGGSRDGYGASDALCMALQVLNHLQDCAEDYRLLDRVYLPADWMAEAGAAVSDLSLPTCSPGLRDLIDRMLDATDALIFRADVLPGGLRSRRLAMESAVIVGIAHRLSSLLRRRDPLAGRVALSKPAYLWCGLRGAVGGLVR